MERTGDMALTEECAKAGQEYLKQKYDGLEDLEKKHMVVNACAHGFWMGVRWLEEQSALAEEAREAKLVASTDSLPKEGK